MSLRHKTVIGRGVEHHFSHVHLPKKATKSENKLLVTSLQAGNEEARDELLLRHVSLVLDIASRYNAKLNSPSLFDDLVGEALAAISKVLEKVRLNEKTLYDFNITPVLTEHCHAAMCKVIEHSNLVRVPRRSLETNSSLKQIKVIGLVQTDENLKSLIEEKLGFEDTPSNIDLDDCIESIVETELERNILKLRTQNIDGKPLSDRKISKILGVSYSKVYEIRIDLGKRLRRKLRE